MKYVYLFNVEGTNVYKIGNSKHPQKRLLQLQTGNPFNFNIIHIFESKFATKLESFLHNKFSYKKYSEESGELNGEFFSLTKEDVENFIEYCQQFENNMILMESSNTYIQDKKK